MAKKQIEIKYTESKTFTNIMATGVSGAPTPQGFIQANFFLELPEDKTKFKIEINDDGSFDEAPRNISTFIREKQVSIVMRPDIAKEIGQWLIKKSEEVSTLSGVENK